MTPAERRYFIRKIEKIEDIFDLIILMNQFLQRKKICLLCGERGEMTKHHIIPIRFKPKFNIKIPLHRACHDIIENNWFNYPFYYDGGIKNNKLR